MRVCSSSMSGSARVSWRPREKGPKKLNQFFFRMPWPLFCRAEISVFRSYKGLFRLYLINKEKAPHESNVRPWLFIKRVLKSTKKELSTKIFYFTWKQPTNYGSPGDRRLEAKLGTRFLLTNNKMQNFAKIALYYYTYQNNWSQSPWKRKS